MPNTTTGPDTPSDPSAGPAAGRSPAEGVVNGACGVVLLLLGIVGAVVVTLAESWLSWLSVAGSTGTALAVASLVGVCCVLFAGGRAVGWATGSRWAPALLAVGWTAGIYIALGLGSGGDKVVLDSWFNQAYLYGTVAALALAATLSEPARAK